MTDPNPTTADQDRPAPEGRCPVCPHPWDEHDAIGRRFCSAKIAGGHGTGCACSRTGRPGMGRRGRG